MNVWMKHANHWMVLFLLTDIAFIFLVWVLRPAAFKNISLFIALFSAIVIAAGIFFERRRRIKIIKMAEAFLETPDEAHRRALFKAAGDGWDGIIFAAFSKLHGQARQLNEKTVDLQAYKEYIEAWVHETKSPLFLLTLLINNHREEITPSIYDRLYYISHQLNEDVERILYYARLQADHKDYKFTDVWLNGCIEEVLDEYQVFAEEKNISIDLQLQPLAIITDKKVFSFMLGQLLSNAVKYADTQNGKIVVSCWQEEEKVYLSVYNNGKGVPPEDAPFIFDKGFTGSHPDRQKATGMGLYLVQKYAEKLCIEVALDPSTAAGDDFKIVLTFTL